MTPDERQRAMDFILKSLADSAVRMDRLDEAQRQSNEAQRQSEQAQRQSEQAQRQSEKAQRQSETAQRQSNEAQRQSDKARLQLERQQIATQAELDTLVLVTRDLLAISRQTIGRVENLESGESQP